MPQEPPVIDYRCPVAGNELPPEQIARLRQVELIIVVGLMSIPAVLLLGLGIAAMWAAAYSGFLAGREIGVWCLAIGSCFAAVAIYAAIRLRRKVQ